MKEQKSAFELIKTSLGRILGVSLNNQFTGGSILKSPATRKKWLFFALFIFLAATLSACGGAQTHMWLDAPGWSRAKLIGDTASEYPVPPALDADGKSYFLLVDDEDDLKSFRIVALDNLSAPIWEKTYPVVAEEIIEYPRVIVLGDSLQLLWNTDDVLYGMRVDLNGEVLQEAEVLSGDHMADNYSVAVNEDGEMSLWFAGSRARPGLYAYVDQEIKLIDEAGYRPQLRLDSTGGLHAVWLQAPTGQVEFHVLYSYTPTGQDELGEAQEVYDFTVPISSTLSGPAIGLDAEMVYVFWSEQARSGMSAGQIDAFYVAFPHGGAQVNGAPQRLTFPYSYTLTYTPADAPLLAGDRALLETQSARASSALIDIYTNTGSADELVIAFRSRLPYLRSKQVPQVGVVFLQDGANTGTQLLSFTSTTSQRPAINSDPNGYLYTTWLEGTRGGGYPVYFASTAPGLVAANAALDSQDVGRLLTETLFGLVSGVLLLPFLFAWGLVPTLFIFFTGIFRRDGEPLTARGSLITVSIAILLYWIAKILILPGILDYIPFSAWIPFIPDILGTILRIGLPILTSLLALRVAWHFTYRRERNSPLFFLLTFIAIDGLVSIAIYGVIFYGAV